MTRPYLRAALGVLALLVLVPAAAAGQDGPRTPWGDPDLQGTYTNKTITPLERPEALGDKVFLTDEEIAEQEQARVQRWSAPTRTCWRRPRGAPSRAATSAATTTSGSTAARGRPTAPR